MRNKIYALIVAVTLFLSMNSVTKAEQKENLKVGTIQFSQLKELPEEFLLEKIPVKPGDEYSNKSLSEIYLALKRLNYISNVNVYPQQDGDTVNLVVEVDEVANALEYAERSENAGSLTEKTEYVISKVDVEGLKTISKEEVLKDVPVKEGDYFVPQNAINGAQKIFQTGHFNSVEPSVEREADNTISIRYIVEENPAVTDITITGNTLFTADNKIVISYNTIPLDTDVTYNKGITNFTLENKPVIVYKTYGTEADFYANIGVKGFSTTMKRFPIVNEDLYNKINIAVSSFEIILED